MRGSQRSRLTYTSCWMRPAVCSLTGANTRSWIAQPKSGRIGRSPGAVDRTSRIASSTSRSPLTRAIPPVGPMRSGNDQPDPTNCSAISGPPAFPNL